MGQERTTATGSDLEVNPPRIRGPLHAGNSSRYFRKFGKWTFLVTLPIASACAPMPSRPAASSPITSTRDASMIERIRQGVTQLIAIPFTDSTSIEQFLNTKLGPPMKTEGFVVRSAAHGALSGIPVHDIEIRTGSDGLGTKVVVMSFEEQSIPFDGNDWPGAFPSPQRPDAAGSTPFWDVRQGHARILLGVDHTEAYLRALSITTP